MVSRIEVSIPGFRVSVLMVMRERVKLRPRRLPKLDLKPMRKEDDLEQWILGESSALREFGRILLLSSCEKTFPITQQDALPNSEVPAEKSAWAGPVASLPRHPLCHPVKADYQSSALQNRRNCNRLPHYDAT
ncbi:hypothetical protein GQ457_16G012780 [Hibiscus cannabinus]